MKKILMKVKLDEKGNPIVPEGWTFLIHGTNMSQWDKNIIEGDSFIVKGNEAGLYCVEKDIAIENAKSGVSVSNLHSEINQKTGKENFEIRCLIYKDLRRKKDREEYDNRLTEEEIEDINNYHVKKPYYPAIPNKTKLVKIATTQFDEITREEKNIIWYVPEKYLEHYIEDSGIKKENIQTISNGKTVEVKKEKGVDFEKTTRSLDGVEINSSKKYEDGSYDEKSRVFVANKGIRVSNKYINYTTYRQQYNAKTKTYTDKTQAPLIDENGKVIGEQESVEVLCIENGKRQVQANSNIENENGIYNLEEVANEQMEKSVLMIENKLSGNREKIQYFKEDGKETYMYMENGVIGEKITKTERGTTIDVYKDGKPYETYEYDENGKAIVQQAGIEQLPEDYVKKCFENVIPEYEVIRHEEPEEIYALDDTNQGQVNENVEQEISTQKLGKETVDIQKDIEKMDSVDQKLNEHMQEQTRSQGEKVEINEFGEIIRKSNEERSFKEETKPQGKENNFKENLKFDITTPTDEQVDKVLDQFEKDLENGVFEKKEMKKKYDHKVEKGDNDYIM